MVGYLITVILLLIWNEVCKHKYEGTTYRKLFLVGTAVIMTFFYGLRAISVGSDTISYVNMFLEDGPQSASGLWNYMWRKKSPGFVLLEWIFYQIIPLPRLWLIFTSGISFAGLSYFIYKNSNEVFFSYYLYFTIFGLFQMTGVRQSLAMFFLMLAYEKIKERNLAHYLVLIGIAYLFHQSSLVFLPMYWVTKKKIWKIDGPILIGIVTLMYGSRSVVFNYIKAFTSYYYFEELNHGEPINFSIMIYTAVLMTFLICLINQKDLQRYGSQNSLLYKKKQFDVVKMSNYTSILYFAAIFMPMVAVNGSVRRIVMYFAVFMIFSIPEVINRIFTRQSAQFVKITLSILLLFLMIKGVSGSSYHYSLCMF